MYLEHFGLQEVPFSLAPDPRYLYLSVQHREALAHLLYGAMTEGGFVQLTGEIGTGKTTVCRCFLERLPEGTEAAVVLNPGLGPGELHAAICSEFRVPPAEGAGRPALERLNEYLLGVHARGGRAVLVIDEAQNLTPSTLEQMRLLTNLETSRHKLLQIILMGQPELRETLARPDLRQLAQRITGRFHLGPLSQAETAEYLRHRLAVAGCHESLFPPDVVGLMQRLSGGVPRLVNILADRALLGAYTQGLRRVSVVVLRQAAREVSGSVGGASVRSRAAAAAAIAAVAALATVAVLALTQRPGPETVVTPAVPGASQLRAPESAPETPAEQAPSESQDEESAIAQEPAAPLPPANSIAPSREDSGTRTNKDVPPDAIQKARSGSSSPPGAKKAPVRTESAARGDSQPPPPAAPPPSTGKVTAEVPAAPMKAVAPPESSSSSPPEPPVPLDAEIAQFEADASPPESKAAAEAEDAEAGGSTTAAAFPPALAAILLVSEAREEDDALRRLFEVLGAEWVSGGGVDACELAARSGIRCLRGRGTWENLLRHARPGVVEIHDAAGAAWVLLEGQAGGQVTLAAGGARTVVPAERLAGFAVDGYLLAWRPTAAADEAEGARVVHP